MGLTVFWYLYLSWKKHNVASVSNGLDLVSKQETTSLSLTTTSNIFWECFLPWRWITNQAGRTPLLFTSPYLHPFLRPKSHPHQNLNLLFREKLLLCLPLKLEPSFKPQCRGNVACFTSFLFGFRNFCTILLPLAPPELAWRGELWG